MKQFLLVPVLFFTLFDSTGISQCVPDNTSNDLFHPSDESGIPEAFEGFDYSAVVTLNIPNDTFGVSIDSAVITALNGLPFGLEYACNPPSCAFLGNTKGCVEVNGVPGQIGDFPLSIGFVIYTPILDHASTYDEYTLTVHPDSANSITEVNEQNLKVPRNFPNPFHSSTLITFQGDGNMKGELVVYNLTGSKVHEQPLDIKAGKNTVIYRPENAVPGVYFYAIKQGAQEMTSRFVIAEK